MEWLYRHIWKRSRRVDCSWIHAKRVYARAFIYEKGWIMEIVWISAHTECWHSIAYMIVACQEQVELNAVKIS